MGTGMNSTPEETIKRRQRLGSIKGNARQAKKKLDHALKTAKKAGRIWEWRIIAIREDIIKLLANLETEEKKMSK